MSANASERAEVMLSVLPWIATRGGATVDELCERFGVERSQMLADLHSVWLNVEPQVGPDHMVEFSFDEDTDWVEIGLSGYFEQPLRLDAEEALQLLACGTALVDDPDFDQSALATAVAKLARSLGPGARDAVRVDLGRADPEVLAEVRSACRERRLLSVHYHSHGRDVVSWRPVEPWAVRSVDGHWYLTGHCRDVDAMRHFRVDRILAVRPEGPEGSFQVPDTVPDPVVPLDGAPRSVRVTVPTDASWPLRVHPVTSLVEDEGVVTAELAVHGEAWLDRLLVQLGPSAEVVDADTGDSLAGRRADTARRILARHGVARADVGPGNA